MLLTPDYFEACTAEHIYRVNCELHQAPACSLYTLVTNHNGYEAAITDFLEQDPQWVYGEINVLLLDLNEDQNLYQALSVRVFISRIENVNQAEISVWQEEEMALKKQEEELKQQEADVKQQQRILQFRQFVHQLLTE